MNNSLHVVVVGSGISGIMSSYLISQKHKVTILEKEDRIGGHTNTRVIERGPDAGTAVDTGFIVLNDRTYPTLHKFFERLQVPVRYSDMSFGLVCEHTGLQYAAPRLNSLFAQRSNIFSVKFLMMIREMARFNAQALTDLEQEKVSDSEELRDYLKRNNISEYFSRNYLIPMAAAIWSSPDDEILSFPVKIFLRFFFNHGLLTLFSRPRWQTVVGGSHAYVKKFKEHFQGEIWTKSSVKSISRQESGATITLYDGESFQADAVVLAVHADQAAKLLADPTPLETELLSSWEYQKNHTLLHTDESFLPTNKNAWASWNYRREKGAEGKEPLSVTYHMNRLQGLHTQLEYCVTLNGTKRPKEEDIHYEIEYEHPVYTKSSVASQKRLEEISGKNNTYYCGSYFGFGFHEDGAKAGKKVGEAFGGAL